MSDPSPRPAIDREAWIGRARAASFVVLAILVAIAGWRFVRPFTPQAFESKSLKAVRLSVEGPEGAAKFIVPLAYLEEPAGDGATLRGEIGRPALTLLAADTLAPCRRTPGCQPGEPGSIRIGAPYPYDFVDNGDDASGPDPASSDRLTDLPGFSKSTAPGAAGGEAGGFRTEVREYRSWRKARVRRVRCNLLVGPGVEIGDCEAVAAWRDGWLIQIVVDVADLKRIEEAADGAANLLDQLGAPPRP